MEPGGLRREVVPEWVSEWVPEWRRESRGSSRRGAEWGAGRAGQGDWVLRGFTHTRSCQPVVPQRWASGIQGTVPRNKLGSTGCSGEEGEMAVREGFLGEVMSRLILERTSRNLRRCVGSGGERGPG